MDKLPFITVAMPVKNEEKFIKNTLIQLLKQNYPKDRFEIIVADGLSTDRTQEIVYEISKNHGQVKLMSNPGMLPSSGRNVGFKNGKGDFFIVVDGHCQIKDNNFLNNVAESFLKNDVDCLGRPQPWVELSESTTQKAIALARTSRIGHSSNSFIHSDEEAIVSPVSVGCAYSKKVFEKIGFLDEKFDACEDVEFNYRVEKAGFKCLFTPKIAVYYYPRETLKALSKQLLRYGEGRAKFMFKHPETINIDMFLPVLFLFGIFIGPFFGFLHLYFLFIYFFFFLLYLSLVFFESFRMGKNSNLKFKFKIAPAFFIIHTSLGAGLLKGFLNKLFKKKNNHTNNENNH